MINRAIATLCRQEGGRILASLIRHFGDFDIAEEALQDAFEQALGHWPAAGVPDNPAGWLFRVARNRGLDQLRKRAPLHHDAALIEQIQAPSRDDDDTAEFGSDDDRLRLIFTCCHPALAPSAQIALTLRTVCQLQTAEIARAFVEPEATTAQKLVRAKRKISQARIPYAIPVREEWPERVAAVLAVVYLLFNEGYAATTHHGLLRLDLTAEAIRLGREMIRLLPDQAETTGLLALMLFHHSRRATRVDVEGVLVPLELQDRGAWDRDEIRDATALLDSALLKRQPGPYQIQAAIAALHANAPTAADTDWIQIVALYGALLRHQPTAVVELNAAAALAMATSPEQGLAWMDRIAASGRLPEYHLLPAARADLLRRMARYDEAGVAYRMALALATNPAETAYLQRRLAQVEAASAGGSINPSRP
ncbi:RNA polymerase sigma factor [Tahibacter amnicola]|uniref:RNA polymerase sigma factor n=1 Tax=Tahibacter amnicola TaxID=2976241 RepID=A0ABY6BJU7_9GAMM|nr:RNA polymerase sigma factor [Tahibacter amnicola]UXI70140.1 RNA polymerase sigma factor [Tahibacter amnicola]